MTKEQALAILAPVTQCLTENSPADQRNALIVLVRAVAYMDKKQPDELFLGYKWYAAIKPHEHYLHYSLLMYILCKETPESINVGHEAIAAYKWAKKTYDKRG